MENQLLEVFKKKKLQKKNQQEFRIEKVTKRKGDKLYVKQKGQDNSFNNLINKPFRSFGRSINGKVDLSNYEKKN